MKIFIFIVVLFSLSFSVNKATKPYTFSIHTTANPLNVNANFDSLKNSFNNSVDTQNIAIPRKSNMFQHLKNGDTLIDTAKIVKAIIKRGNIDTVLSDSINVRTIKTSENINIATGSHYKINNVNLNYSDVGAANANHGVSVDYIPKSTSTSGWGNSPLSVSGTAVSGDSMYLRAGKFQKSKSDTFIFNYIGSRLTTPVTPIHLNGKSYTFTVDTFGVLAIGRTAGEARPSGVIADFLGNITNRGTFTDTGMIAATNFLGNYFQFGTTADSQFTYKDTLVKDTLYYDGGFLAWGWSQVVTIGNSVSIHLKNSLYGSGVPGATNCYISGIPTKYFPVDSTIQPIRIWTNTAKEWGTIEIARAGSKMYLYTSTGGSIYSTDLLVYKQTITIVK
jgi:hypothetical protein